MRPIYRNLVTLGLGAALLAGCGGGGGEDYTKIAPSPYQGAYTGTWTSPSLSQSGPLVLTILASGVIDASSSMGIDQLQITGQPGGRIGYNGHFDYDRSNSTESTHVNFGSQGIYELHDGTMTVTSDGTIRGTFVIHSFAQSFPATFELKRAGSAVE